MSDRAALTLLVRNVYGEDLQNALIDHIDQSVSVQSVQHLIGGFNLQWEDMTFDYLETLVESLAVARTLSFVVPANTPAFVFRAWHDPVYEYAGHLIVGSADGTTTDYPCDASGNAYVTLSDLDRILGTCPGRDSVRIVRERLDLAALTAFDHAIPNDDTRHAPGEFL